MIVDWWSFLKFKNPLILLKIIADVFKNFSSAFTSIYNFRSMNQQFYKNYDSKNPFENLGKQAKVCF